MIRCRWLLIVPVALMAVIGGCAPKEGPITWRTEFSTTMGRDLASHLQDCEFLRGRGSDSKPILLIVESVRNVGYLSMEDSEKQFLLTSVRNAITPELCRDKQIIVTNDNFRPPIDELIPEQDSFCGTTTPADERGQRMRTAVKSKEVYVISLTVRGIRRRSWKGVQDLFCCEYVLNRLANGEQECAGMVELTREVKGDLD